MPPDEPATDTERIVVLAPTGRDAEILTQQLQRHGFAACCCGSMAELPRFIAEGVGVLLIANEALHSQGRTRLAEILREQPPWSDLPVLLMTGAHDPVTGPPGGSPAGFIGNVTVLERPIRLATLFSVVASALRARRRQYQICQLLKEAQLAVEQRDQFLALLGHELRNPLAAIINAVAILRRSPDQGPEDIAEQCDVVSRQASIMARLVGDLLDVARITAGKISLQRTVVDLRDIARRSLQALRLVMPSLRQQIVFETPEEAVCVEGDVVRLEQIVSNLLTNAVKYTPPDGTIHLRVTSGSRPAVVVVDTGEGIPVEMLERIFHPFEQLGATLERSHGGLGMGLTVVRALARMHGGEVTAHSEGPGRGSEFRVTLPPSAKAPPSGEPGVAAIAPSRGCRVLIVEDNVDSRRTLRKLLNLAGHHVDTASDGHEGVRAARERSPDVILLDIGLPGLDGLEVARQIRASENGRRPHLIALTGYGRNEDRDRIHDAGFDMHLVKPVDPERLLQLVADLSCVPPAPASQSEH